MKNRQWRIFQIQTLLVLLLVCFLSGNSLASVTADIKVNNSSTAQTFSESDQFIIAISLDQVNYTGIDADWWLVASTSNGWFHYNLNGSWQPGLSPTYQGPIINLPNFEVVGPSGQIAGEYTFYFGIDTMLNGQVDLEELFFDSIPVTIQVNQPADPLIGTWVDNASGYKVVISAEITDMGSLNFYSGQVYYPTFHGNVVNVSGYPTDPQRIRVSGKLGDYDHQSNCNIYDIFNCYNNITMLVNANDNGSLSEPIYSTVTASSLNYKIGTNIITGGLTVNLVTLTGYSQETIPVSLVRQ